MLIVGTGNTTLPVLLVSAIIAIVAGIAYFIFKRQDESKGLFNSPDDGKKKYSELRIEAKSQLKYDQRTVEPPKFWSIKKAIALLVGFMSIVLGWGYFWNVPFTPSADFLAGLACVIGGF